MILSDLLDSRVLDSAKEPVGCVLDIRVVKDGDRLRLESLIVGPHRRMPFLGYERTGLDRPKIFAFIFRRMHAGTLIIPWREVEQIDPNRIRLRQDYSAEQLIRR